MNEKKAQPVEAKRDATNTESTITNHFYGTAAKHAELCDINRANPAKQWYS